MFQTKNEKKCFIKYRLPNTNINLKKSVKHGSSKDNNGACKQVI